MKFEPFENILKDSTSNFTKVKKEDYQNVGTYPIVDQGQAFIGGYTDDENLVVRENLPVIIFGDHTKIFKYVDFPFTIGADGVKVLTLKNKKDNALFYYYFLKSIKIVDKGYSRHFKYLKEKKLPVAEYPDQLHIANLLSKAENLIAQRKESIRLLDEFLKSTFLEMFGEFDNETPLESFCSFSQGIQVPVEEQYPMCKEGQVRFLRIIDFTQSDEPRYIENLGERYFVSEDDVCMVRYGASAGFVGFGKVGIIANNLFKFNFDKNKVLPIYLVYVLQTTRFKNYIKLKSTGSAMPALSFGMLNDYKIAIPPIELQSQFAHIVEKTETLKTQYQQSLTEFENLYGSLSQKAFKGELTLKNHANP
jgi:type I restriction enzyme S subunit